MIVLLYIFTHMPMSYKKQIMSAIALSSILLSASVGAEYDTTTQYNQNNGYKEVIVDTSLDFEATRENQTIKMSWENYNKADFAYYKVMRSVKDENPTYPEISAIRVIDNNDIHELEIDNWSDDTAFYRVCVITTQRARYCSNVVKLEGFDKEEYNTEHKKEYSDDKYLDKKETYNKELEEKKQKQKEEYEKRKAELAEKLAQKNKENKEKFEKKTQEKMKKITGAIEKKANTAIDNFVKRVEKKFDSDEKRAEALTKVITRLEKLGQEKENLRPLVEHMIMKLKDKLEKYNNDFSEIENILNDF